MTTSKSFLYLNGEKTYFDNERNILEVIRKAGIDIPTFCYHSELSVYGACRLCLVEVEGRGIISSCSAKPEQGMRIYTSTPIIREIRKINLELLLANHAQDCPTCVKNSSCRLQTIARKVGVTNIRFKQLRPEKPLDNSAYGIVRDPNKCILCGDCVRACHEIQSIGAIDFAFRGHDLVVTPAFKKGMGDVSCVECGQCIRVCPTGALTPKFDVDELWNALNSPGKYVVAQIAPAVRVALGELFGMPPGTDLSGQIVAALKDLGFKKVYDTPFSADLTVIEEAHEFIQRKMENQNLPMFTSCCPAWVKFAEFYFPEFLPNISTCRSPQQMLGSIVKRILPKELGMHREDIIMVSIMPCTAKRSEANRPEFALHGTPDVDIVLTTQELGSVIYQAGLQLDKIEPESFDLPFGFKTGAGLIFGSSGGVSEAVLRLVAEKLTGKPFNDDNFIQELRASNGIRDIKVDIDGKELNFSIVHGLRNARYLINEIKKGKANPDFVEVMACPGGCVGGGGQPISSDLSARRERARSLYRSDRTMQVRSSQDNPYISHLYDTYLGKVGGEKAEELLHTHYIDRSEVFEGEVVISTAEYVNDQVELKVCFCPNCLANGSDELLTKLVDYASEEGLTGRVVIVAYRSLAPCSGGVTVFLNDDNISDSSFDAITRLIKERTSSYNKGAN